MSKNNTNAAAKKSVVAWMKHNGKRVICIVLCVVLAASLVIPALQTMF